MATPIPGDRFIRTFTHYLDSNEIRLTSGNPSLKKRKSDDGAKKRNGTTAGATPDINNSSNNTPSSIATAMTSLFTGGGSSGSSANNDVLSSSQSFKTSTTGGTPASLYGIQVPYMSLLMAASPTASALSMTPYMPPRCTLSLDIHHYYFLLVQFEHLGFDVGDPALLGEIPEDGVVETETSVNDEAKAPSIMSVGSIASTMSTLSLSTGWNFWQKGTDREEQHKPLHEDIMHIYKFFARVSALKLQMNLLIDPHNATTRSSQRAITHYEQPLPQDGSVILSLSPFQTLSFLELSGIHPRFIDGWAQLRQNLVSLVVKGANVEDAADVINKDLENGAKAQADRKEEEEERQGNVSWQQLKMLSLADNNLTTLDNEPLRRIQSVTHLNLSSNLLIDVPAALSNLYNLQSLQLAYNMVSFVNGINTVLGNVQELDLRGNRLTMLAGLDRLWALERLDLRDNRIEDSAEIGRLTTLPNLEDVWVQGNPFTIIQPDYRVDIFSTFKQAGLEIQLDGSRPTFAERRRVSASTTTTDHYKAPAASVAPPVWPTAQAGAAAAAAATATGGSSGGESDSTKTEQRPQQPKIARAKTRKSKRVIKLGQQPDEEGKRQEQKQQGEDEAGGRRMHRVAELEEDQLVRRASTSSSSRKRRSRSKVRRSQSPSEDKKDEQKHRSVSPATQSFRRKIESMRREAGTEWLRVLQEMELGKSKQNTSTTTATATDKS
ncbi:hypothetical protein BDB00DRAFT_868940 [Zychaea mexicana]|uniref:uncharacterized protein n=1 Tax=Zychaea mexicana TaxID=64656 RepID=UPI0022FEDC65|nr:uncharacterized protein BDB00DRAFT_868940 [Zychaea mexicana]KAI9497105.1 hypothetical protein BDB00DRAFT_868940 [Zychaea mexicana]